MIRPILAASSIALALAASATAQQTPSPDQPKAQDNAQQVDPSLVGLSVFSSDGQKLGQVAEVGMSAGGPAVRADMGEFLGTGTGSGTGSVVIAADAFQKKADRIEIAMTADEVKDTISKQRQQRKQP